jgi:hypothetical protein
MNMSLIISTIVGGLLMLAMIGLNTRVTQSSSMKTMQFATKAKVEAISAYITADLRQVGAGITAGNQIVQLAEHNLMFRRVGANGSLETIRWVWNPSIPDNVSTNPRDRKLYRIVGTDTTDFGSGIVSFRYRYFTATGDSTLTLSAVRRIRVRMIVESNVSYMNEWARSYWETDVTPRGLIQ